MSRRRAAVLFNLGGPDSLEAVRPFLFNLFNDSAILRQGPVLRWLLAQLISRKRAATARDIYRQLGGQSPILERTQAQAAALEAAMADHGTKVFVCMRHWHPMTDQVIHDVLHFDPEEIVLLPLYPQFSTTTSGSSLKQWHSVAAERLSVPTTAICCYPDDPGFIDAVHAGISAALENWAGPAPRILYTAHGIPKAFVAAGDPYQAQVERTAAALKAKLMRDDLDQVLCYQSRVGPLEWTGPYTDAEIVRAGQKGLPLVVVPIAFVSEHAETLIELDRDYRLLAERAGVPHYVRVPTVGTDQRFIEGLARLVRTASEGRTRTLPGNIKSTCESVCTSCPRVPARQTQGAA